MARGWNGEHLSRLEDLVVRVKMVERLLDILARAHRVPARATRKRPARWAAGKEGGGRPGGKGPDEKNEKKKPNKRRAGSG